MVGVWSIVPSPMVSEIAGSSGLDFILLDLEHGIFDLPSLHSCIVASESQGCSPIVRIPRVGDSVIQNVLDMGAHGVLTPQIQNYEQAVHAVKAGRFPPEGIRGYNPFTRAGTYNGARDSNLARRLSNEFPLQGILLETQEAYSDLDRILEIPGLDVVYLGAYDMSIALGCRGDFANPRLVDFLETATRKIRAKGIAAGAIYKDASDYARLKKMGTNFFVCGVDSGIFRNAMVDAVSIVKGR